MSLVKRRPSVSLRAPRVMVPGQSVILEAQLDAPRDVPVDYVRVGLAGNERSTVGSGKSQTTYRSKVLWLAAVPVEAGTLRAGTHRFPCRFDLPGGLPPSYSGVRAATEYTATVRVSIPWWPDRVERYVLHVAASPIHRQYPAPHVWSSDVAGPRGNEPHLEASVDDDTLVPGGVLAGTVALSNVGSNRYRSVRLTLSAMETKYDSRGRDRGTTRAKSWTLELPVQGVAEGEPVPFRMRVPAEVSPTWRSTLWNLAWTLEVRAVVAWASDLAIDVPLTVLPAGSSPSRLEDSAPPAVGSERVRRLWQRVAGEVGLELAGDVMRGRVGDVELSVRREHRGAQGPHLVGELRYPSVQLGMDGGLASGFRRIVGGGVSFGDAGWDRDHYIAGRDPAQVRSFGVVLFAQLREHRVADFDDEHLIVEKPDAGTSHATLRAFAASLRRLAVAIPRARDAIPPPETMADHVDGWRRLSAELEGPLELARMAVAGRWGGFQCEVFTDWSAEGAPVRTAVVLRSPFPIDAEHRFAWTPGTELDGYASRLPRGAAELLGPLGDGALAWTVGEQAVTVSLPAPMAEPAGPVLERLGVASRLVGLLRQGAGPYR